MKQITAYVISNREVMPGVYLIWLESPQIASEAKPGQFVMVRCGEDTLLRRPLSVHQVDGGKMALLFAIVGKGTTWLSQRQIEDTVDIFGPLGNGFSIQPASKNLLLVAGGIGIAPLYFLSQDILQRGLSVTLGIGATTAVSLNPLQQLVLEIRDFADDNKPKTRIVPFSEDGTSGTRGLVMNLIKESASDFDSIYACGPIGMYHTMAQMPELKNKPVQISLEVRMGCGRGVCYGCTLKTKSGLKQVCTDGPIFDLDDILWDYI